jgi:uncharacterized repeat protein (TIGR03803 family)
MKFKTESMRTNWPVTTTLHVAKLGLAKMACVLFVFCAVTAIVSPAQTFRTLLDFNGTDGSAPFNVSPVQGTDGNFYGTTDYGGNNGVGTVFKVTAVGTLTTLYSFCSETNCADGSYPVAGVVQGTDGNFYGTTQGGGGSAGAGTIFKITPAGTLTTLHTFCVVLGFDCPDGATPLAGLVQGSDGNFYGTTYGGGCVTYSRYNCLFGGYGTVFKITPAGVLTTLYIFCSASGCTDGIYPFAGLVQGSDGNFYGTASAGGGTNYGTVFKITAAGKLTTVYSFCSETNCTDGRYPLAGVVQGTDGNFYGTTALGGNNNGGTVFKVTAAGTLTTLYSFCSETNCADGYYPVAGVVQGTDGNFYGTTQGGGGTYCPISYNCGTVFKITAAGKTTTLYNFEGAADGSSPNGLTQATNGNFYGTTSSLNQYFADGDGTVFSLSMGLGPFVETRPTSGTEGAKIGILGQGFTSSSVVQFGGVKATAVKLTGTTFLSATVPAGALTGPVTVTTGSAKLTSNHKFDVRPQVKSFTPLDGPAGTVVTITGTGLKQTSKVTFGGVNAIHTVDSDTQIKATVPTGAKTGKIAITTLGGAATSADSFTVTE